jgi:hypothetical protein
VIISQVVPHYRTELSLVQRYRRDILALEPGRAPSFVSLEGYIAAEILVRALKKINGEVTREAIVDALESLGKFDPGIGVSLKLSRKEHQASHYVWPTIVRRGWVESYTLKELAHGVPR